MKNPIILCLFALLSFQISSAAVVKDSIFRFSFQKMQLESALRMDCDACGCSASGGSMGFSSMLNKNFVGVRYFNQSYSSRDGIFANSPWIAEDFNTTQIWGKIPVTNKIKVAALIPYHFHNRALTAGTEKISGLGDMTLMATYLVYQTQKDSTLLDHNLQIGGGLKMPTGKFSEANNRGTVNQSFQLGTGSWDYLLLAEYVVKKKKLGLNTMVNYNLKTENEKKYQFGNQLNYSSTLFYLFTAQNIQVVPQFGVAGEVYETNKQHGQKVHDTAGDVLFSKFGLEIGKDKFSLGLNGMLPLSQNLSNGNMEANSRWSVHLNYSL
ncbi:transporter [Flavobacterium crassostreae]|uniref:Transporter n=1 Tax=Flavobacterium crassostreae TaxID=1763534 RepID=A0A1B9E816_9FLAO|nr:transporter [Flavobacterium crassostreae]OCB78082.1 hypothetical protein LPBF_03815 [Flavobacterium crassostreae]